MVRITEKLVRLVRDGREPPQSWADPVEWRPREYNKRADFLCNQCLDTSCSYEYVDPDAGTYASMMPNWMLYTDGGCRKVGASAFSWIIYAVLKAGEEWCPFTVAFGYEWVDRDQSSFVVEAQGLDKGLQVLQFILDLSPQGVEQTV